MDADVIQKLEAAGLSTDPTRLGIAIPKVGGTLAHDSEPGVLVGEGSRTLRLELRPLSALFVGERRPPSFKGQPPEEYLPLFHALEHAAAVACVVRGRPETDDEFERLYRHLRRRPDGTDANPMFDVLQNAARLYLSLRDVSRAEFEAVVDRLSRSARTFRTHVGSTHYFLHALEPLLQQALSPKR